MWLKEMGWFQKKPERRLLRNRITGGAVKKPEEYEIWKEKAANFDPWWDLESYQKKKFL